MISFRPVTARLASRILGKSLIDSAERTVEIAPGTRWSVEPPVMLPDEAKRILGHHADSTPATNLARINQRIIEQGPTRMHLVRDALLFDGSVLTRTSFDRFSKGSRSAIARGRIERISEAALCSTQVTELYFGHWLKDGVTHELLAADQGLVPLTMDAAPYSHRGGYRKLLQLKAHPSSFAHIDRLWILEDHENNAHFVSRYERLRQRIGQQKPARKLFLARGDRVGRRLINENEIRLALPDFEFIYPENMTAPELVSILSQACLVISPEGSAISHATIAMPRGSTLLTIIGAQHFNMPYKVLCDALGIRFALTVADAVDASDFSQPVHRLLRTIDACL